ncbi:MAG: tripartite tricarboxylate transporter substrate-binding protein [Burkholderiaceae bacterium]
MIMINRILLSASLLLCALLIPFSPTQAQAPLRVLVGFPPGGTTDGVARLYAGGMAQALSRTVVVENKPGAGGVVAAMALKGAPADGNTLMLAAIVNISIYPSIADPAAYDPFRDFVPVSLVGKYDLALAVNKASGINSVADYVKWVRGNPAKANFGSPGSGSLPHLFGLQLARATGIELVHVPFQGAAPSITNLIGGQIGAVIQPVSDLLPQHQAGRLQILASTGAQRNPSLPDVPTFAELGYERLQGSGWIGFFAPAATPRKSLQATWEAVQATQALPEVKARMQALGFEAGTMSSADFEALARSDAARWAAVVQGEGGAARIK